MFSRLKKYALKPLVGTTHSSESGLAGLLVVMALAAGISILLAQRFNEYTQRNRALKARQLSTLDADVNTKLAEALRIVETSVHEGNLKFTPTSETEATYSTNAHVINDSLFDDHETTLAASFPYLNVNVKILDERLGDSIVRVYFRQYGKMHGAPFILLEAVPFPALLAPFQASRLEKRIFPRANSNLELVNLDSCTNFCGGTTNCSRWTVVDPIKGDRGTPFFEISSVEDLYKLKRGLAYKLTQDIDFTNSDKSEASLALREIYLDGNGKKIKNFSFTTLFSSAGNAIIHNLTIENAIINGSPTGIGGSIGGLFGYSYGNNCVDNVTMKNVTVNGDGNSNGYDNDDGSVGGVSADGQGTNFYNITLDGLTLNNSTGTTYMGGISGTASNSRIHNIKTLTPIVFKLPPNSTASVVGGLVGLTQENVHISSSTVQTQFNISTPTKSLGGLIGKAEGTPTIRSVRVEPDFRNLMEPATDAAGGLIGSTNNATSTEVTDVAVNGQGTLSGHAIQVSVGGLIGLTGPININRVAVKFTNPVGGISLFAGSDSSTVCAQSVGGLIGKMKEGAISPSTISNSFTQIDGIINGDCAVSTSYERQSGFISACNNATISNSYAVASFSSPYLSHGFANISPFGWGDTCQVSNSYYDDDSSGIPLNKEQNGVFGEEGVPRDDLKVTSPLNPIYDNWNPSDWHFSPGEFPSINY